MHEFASPIMNDRPFEWRKKSGNETSAFSADISASEKKTSRALDPERDAKKGFSPGFKNAISAALLKTIVARLVRKNSHPLRPRPCLFRLFVECTHTRLRTYGIKSTAVRNRDSIAPTGSGELYDRPKKETGGARPVKGQH